VCRLPFAFSLLKCAVHVFAVLCVSSNALCVFCDFGCVAVRFTFESVHCHSMHSVCHSTSHMFKAIT